MYKIRNIFLCFSLLLLIGGDVVLAKPSASKRQRKPVPISQKKIVRSANINTADVKTISKIKGIGKKTAAAIVDYRNKNGKFKSLEDLLNIKYRTINKKWLDRFRKFLTL